MRQFVKKNPPYLKLMILKCRLYEKQLKAKKKVFPGNVAHSTLKANINRFGLSRCLSVGFFSDVKTAKQQKQ